MRYARRYQQVREIWWRDYEKDIGMYEHEADADARFERRNPSVARRHVVAISRYMISGDLHEPRDAICARERQRAVRNESEKQYDEIICVEAVRATKRRV